MIRKTLSGLLFAACAVAGSFGASCFATKSTSETHSIDNATQKPDSKLAKQIETIAATAKGHVGVSAVVIETGMSVSLNAGDHFPMQSVYKLPISMTVLSQVDAGKLTLDQKVP